MIQPLDSAGSPGMAMPGTPVPAPAAGAYPARSGNRVQPLVDGIPAFRRMAAAIATARRSLWLSVTFYAPDFTFPDGGPTLFDMLDGAARRGLDVRVLFWRPNPQSSGYGSTFGGTEADRDLLRRREAAFAIRWDRAPGPHCQHQKMWIMDAGEAGETAFVGGINLTAANLASPGHAQGRGRHDLYAEITGPSATDVHHNFVQRWNEASERAAPDGTWGEGGGQSLPFPTRASPPCGGSTVQIQRMVAPGRYADAHPTPGGQPYAIAGGERSVVEQYEQAIDAARSSIYIENQALPIPPIARRLEAALRRGVDVVLLVPGEPEGHVREARRLPDLWGRFDAIEALGRHAHFLLAGLAVPAGPAEIRQVYVHAKTMLVDDAWATIGSCNLHRYSLFGHTEMNAAIWDAGVVRALRRALLAEHLGEDTGALDDRAALHRYGAIARRNRLTMNGGGGDWQGLAFAIDPLTYGR